jgi:beta-RFAP synthase
MGELDLTQKQNVRKVTIRSTARLHLGFLDLHGGLKRRFGSLGVSIQEPRNVLEMERTESEIVVTGSRQDQISSYVKQLCDSFEYSGGIQVTDWEAIPKHVGLGSGTQLALALGAGLATLLNKQVNVKKLAQITQRGVVSGIGTATFSQGGFVIDGGHPFEPNSTQLKQSKPYIPPLIIRHSIPEDWIFIIAIPNVSKGLSGADEERAFKELPRTKPKFAHMVSRLVLMKLLPAIVDDDIVNFGQALTAIQILVGNAFDSLQGGRFSSPEVANCIETFLQAGAYGAGQSSWGPACYGLIRESDDVKSIEKAITDVFNSSTGGTLITTKVNNSGVQISIV